MADYSYETLLVDKQDSILTITMNRPERLNAVDEVMHRELEGVFGAVGADPEVSAVVLTGAGRGFCSGGDMRAMDERGARRPMTAARNPPILWCLAAVSTTRRGLTIELNPFPRRPKKLGRIAQLARALPSHGRGHRFESCCAHCPALQCSQPRPPAFPQGSSHCPARPCAPLLHRFMHHPAPPPRSGLPSSVGSAAGPPGRCCQSRRSTL